MIKSIEAKSLRLIIDLNDLDQHISLLKSRETK